MSPDDQMVREMTDHCYRALFGKDTRGLSVELGVPYRPADLSDDALRDKFTTQQLQAIETLETELGRQMQNQWVFHRLQFIEKIYELAPLVLKKVGL